MWRTFAAIILFIPSMGFAQYYKCVQADGKTAFQDTPCAATATTKIIPTQESKDHSDPIKAAATVGAMDTTLSRMEQWCQQSYEPAHANIAAARTKWLERHEKLLAKAIQILTEKFSVDEIRALTVVTARENDRVLETLEKAGPAKAKEWCVAMPQRIVSPEMNLNGKLVLVATIKNYKLESTDKQK
jgi:hypothetical protein